MLMTSLNSPSAGPQPKNWTKALLNDQSADIQLVADTLNALECLTTVPTGAVRISARHRWILLEGTVSSSEQRITIEKLIRNLLGVKGITDRLEVVVGT